METWKSPHFKGIPSTKIVIWIFQLFIIVVSFWVFFRDSFHKIHLSCHVCGRGCIPNQGSVAPWRVEALHQAPPGLFRDRGWNTQLCGDFLSSMESIKQLVEWKVAHLMHGSSHHTLIWVIYGIAYRIQKDFGYGSLSLSYYVLDSRIDDVDTYSHIYVCVVLYVYIVCKNIWITVNLDIELKNLQL